MKIKHTVQQGDCVEGLDKLAAGSVDLVFADPPFNIGYDYDIYEDRQEDQKYLDWSKKWMTGVHRALKGDGTFWLAIGDEYAAELKTIATREIGFTCRSWVIWYYTFGVHCKYKFTRSHAHLFHFVKDAKQFTFNAAEVKVPSARQLVYGDKRAEKSGRIPDDTWIMSPPGVPTETWVLRPQDIPEGFSADSDSWYFARVAGTFKERAGFHGCQMPEQLLGRIIRVSSQPGELVLDPFAGSGSTLIVAKKLGRSCLGFELSKDYAGKVRERLASTEAGEPLSGPADPLRSAPRTPAAGEEIVRKPGRRREARKPAAEGTLFTHNEDAA
jgi:site-specific DNA-methyltransferase (adenine-specific)